MTADQVPNVLVLNTPPSPPTELDDATDIIWVGGWENFGVCQPVYDNQCTVSSAHSKEKS